MGLRARLMHHCLVPAAMTGPIKTGFSPFQLRDSSHSAKNHISGAKARLIGSVEEVQMTTSLRPRQALAKRYSYITFNHMMDNLHKRLQRLGSNHPSPTADTHMIIPPSQRRQSNVRLPPDLRLRSGPLADLDGDLEPVGTDTTAPRRLSADIGVGA